MEPFDSVGNAAPREKQPLLSSIVCEAAREAIQPVTQGLYQTVCMIAAYTLVLVVQISPNMTTFYLFFRLAPSFLESHWYLVFVISFTATYMARCLFSLLLDLFNCFAERTWGRAYMRRLPKWMASRDLKRATRDLRSSFSDLPSAFYFVWSLVHGRLNRSSTQICPLCKNLDPGRTYISFGQELALPYTDLRANRRHCATCAILATAVGRLFPITDSSSPFYYQWEGFSPREDMYLMWNGRDSSVRVEREYVTSYWPSLSFYCIEKQPGLPIISSPKACINDTTSETSLHRVQSWLTKCTMEHEYCNRKEPKPFPDRILDLGSASDETIRLVETRNQLGYYACLSHTWGSVQPLRTLKGNVESFKAGLPIDMLPKTFREAVAICRRLSLRYLWIDSLCIIQDSPEEWQRQSSKMATIFENAFLTVAATKAKGHQEGLHPEDQEKNACLDRIPAFDLGNGVVVDIWARLSYPNNKTGIQHWHTERLDASTVEDQWPLLTRAWVFQERLLSPRMLHFAKRELVWECRTCVSCDCGMRHDEKSDDLEFRRLVSRQSIKTSDVTPMQLRYLWYAIVERYSHVMGNLKVESDVFPALSGLASRISGLLGDDYAAGLWRGHMVEGLLWARGTDYDRKDRGKPKSWRAPSWSWASIVGEISYKHKAPSLFGSELQEIYASVVDVRCKFTGSQKTGAISSAVLLLSGWVSYATIRIRRTNKYYMWGAEYDAPAVVSQSYTLEWHRRTGWDVFYPDHPEDVADGDTVACVRLAKIGRHDWYMVLARESSASSFYKRLGLLEAEHMKWAWTSPTSWRRRAEERYHEVKETLRIV
ncbi:hypothetical protein F66182_2824 [Fusarium sp. NRRL 66182]|nr:hypothetical protein F66182_2824 [Fusarium sp. NRRL 66182]